MELEDFKEGGSKRKYITAMGILPLIDAATEMTVELEDLIKRNYTMCDDYLAE